MFKLEVASRGVVSIDRSVVPPFAFFDLMLNNALALRASQNLSSSTCPASNKQTTTLAKETNTWTVSSLCNEKYC